MREGKLLFTDLDSSNGTVMANNTHIRHAPQKPRQPPPPDTPHYTKTPHPLLSITNALFTIHRLQTYNNAELESHTPVELTDGGVLILGDGEFAVAIAKL